MRAARRAAARHAPAPLKTDCIFRRRVAGGWARMISFTEYFPHITAECFRQATSRR